MNNRLAEIQTAKDELYQRIERTFNIGECLELKSQIDELIKEENTLKEVI